jgi:hypothetical protein
MEKVKNSGKRIWDTKCGCYSYMEDPRKKQ